MTVWFYPIDWATTGVWMQAWAGFAGAGTVAWAAHLGVATFLKQRQIERKIAAAERIMTFIYKAERTFLSIRSPGYDGHESEGAEEKIKVEYGDLEHLPQHKRSRLIWAQVMLSRLASAKDLWAELFECLPVARAFFGAACKDIIHKIWALRAQVYTSAHGYARIEPQSDHEFSEQCEFDMWDGWAQAKGKTDRIERGLREVIQYAESNVLPLIAGNSPDGAKAAGFAERLAAFFVNSEENTESQNTTSVKRAVSR